MQLTFRNVMLMMTKHTSARVLLLVRLVNYLFMSKSLEQDSKNYHNKNSNESTRHTVQVRVLFKGLESKMLIGVTYVWTIP